jgi:hypothetical protein
MVGGAVEAFTAMYVPLTVEDLNATPLPARSISENRRASWPLLPRCARIALFPNTSCLSLLECSKQLSGRG